jgi:DNA-binding response OmpR family regulator
MSLILSVKFASKLANFDVNYLHLKSDNCIIDYMENTQKFAPGTKIIIVEDDKFLGGLVSKKLIDSGCTVTHVESGEQAQAVVEAEKPNLIFLDLLLPGMSGFDVLAGLKNVESTKNIPVILLSNLGEREDIRRGLDLGATSFLIKASMTVDSIVSEASKILRARS